MIANIIPIIAGFEAGLRGLNISPGSEVSVGEIVVKDEADVVGREFNIIETGELP